MSLSPSVCLSFRLFVPPFFKPVKTRERGDRYCQLCLSEKAFILRSDPELTLNKRSELLRRCRHRDSLMLSNFYSRTFERNRRSGRRQIGIDREEQIIEEEGSLEDQGGGPGGGMIGDPARGPEEEQEGGPERRREGGQEGGLEGGQEGGREEGQEGGLGGEERQLRERERERVDYSAFY